MPPPTRFTHVLMEAQAAKVKQALEILSLGDDRVQETDRFLAAIRVSPAAWPVLHALIHSPCSQLSLISLTFAARTLHMRLRADWLAFDDPAREAAFSLAVDGNLQCAAVLQTSASPVYFFSRAIGFAVSQAIPDVRCSMWRVLYAKFTDPILRCHVLAAVVHEIDETSTRDVARHMETRAFCVEKAPEVVSVAVRLLQPPTVSSEADLSRLRAGVTCLQAWCMYGEKPNMAMALMPVLVSPQLADIVAETLTEIVGYSGTALDLLVGVCDGLTLAFRSIGGAAASEVHHAIAEVACSLSEGNADELMEQSSEESRLVVSKITELLWLCLKSPDDRAFCAALEGWASWIAAENLVKESQRKLGKTQIARLVDVVVQRMKNLQFVEAAVCPEQSDVMEFTDEKGFVTDLLFEASISIGIADYVNVVSALFTVHGDQYPNSICAALMALAIAGDSVESVTHDGGVSEIVYDMLDRVLTLLETSTAGNGGLNSCTAIRRAALHVLSCYAIQLAVSPDETLYRTVRCAGTGILDSEVSENAAQLLRDLAEGSSARLVRFLPELVSLCKGALHRISKSAAEKCVKGLGRVASDLSSEEERMKAMDELLSDMCEAIRWASCENKVAEHEESVCRNLTLISAAMYEMNDSEASGRIFESLQGAIFNIAVSHCGKSELATSICKLLEVCVLPTLLDDDNDTRKRSENGRLNLAIACAELAGECFKRSGPYGETAWLTTLGDLTVHVLWGAECGLPRAQECLTLSVGRALEGLSMFCCDGYDTRADMTVSYLRLVNRIISRCSKSLMVHVTSMTKVAMDGLRCNNVAIVRESLGFWRQTFSCTNGGDMAEAIIVAGGGPGNIAGGILCGAQISRCAGSVVDVLYGLCRVIGGGTGGGNGGGNGGSDVTDLLRGLLEEGFKIDGVPRQGLDGRVREMLFRDCYCSAGNRRELRRALGQVGRVCSMAIQ